MTSLVKDTRFLCNGSALTIMTIARYDIVINTLANEVNKKNDYTYYIILVITTYSK